MKSLVHFHKIVNSYFFSKSKAHKALHDIMSESVYTMASDRAGFSLKKGMGLPVVHTLPELPQFDKQKMCLSKLPLAYCKSENPNRAAGRVRKDKTKIYPDLYSASLSQNIANPVIRQSMKILHDNWGVTGVKQDDSWVFFQSNAKGTPAYNKKVYWKIHDVCTALDWWSKDIFFLTLTMSQREYNGNAYQAWKDFSEKLQLTMQYLSREWKCKYVWVKEAHSSGFPHAHVLLYFPRKVEGLEYNRPQCDSKQWVRSGKLKSDIDKFWAKGFTRLQHNYRNSTENYLSKYISKSTVDEVEKLMNNPHWKKSHRKEALTILMPILTETRSYGTSRVSSIMEAYTRSLHPREFWKFDKSVERLDKRVSDEWGALEWEMLRTDLITLCNNSTLPCARAILLTSEKRLNEKFGTSISGVNELEDIEKERIAHDSCILGCQGCIYGEVMRFIINRGDWSEEREASLESWLPRFNHAVAELARFSGVTEQAILQMEDTEPIIEYMAYDLPGDFPLSQKISYIHAQLEIPSFLHLIDDRTDYRLWITERKVEINSVESLTKLRHEWAKARVLPKRWNEFMENHREWVKTLKND